MSEMTRGFRATVSIVVALLGVSCAAPRPPAPSAAGATSTTPTAAARCRCGPSEPCWPSQADWRRFGAGLHGKLEVPESPFAPCRNDAAGEACAAAMRNAKNPYLLQDQSGVTQSAGWLGAWNAAPS